MSRPEWAEETVAAVDLDRRSIILGQLLKALDEIATQKDAVRLLKSTIVKLKIELANAKAGPTRPVLAFRLPEPPEPGMIPCAHPVSPCDGWSLYWESEDGSRQAHDPEISWPFADSDYATAADMERIGFRVTP